MKAVIQRVLSAQVEVGGVVLSQIAHGVLTLFCVEKGDEEAQIAPLMEKICNLRIFNDDDGKMNRSLIDVKGSHLIVSQFTLAADCSSGRRPSFTKAAPPEIAKTFYDLAITASKAQGVRTQGGQFQAEMKVSLVNDGPVTVILS